MGCERTNTTVSICGSDGSYSATSRKGEYYRGELAVDNTTNSLWLTVTNVAVLTNGGGSDIATNTTGNAFLAQTPEVFVYDLDGNLTVDGRWTNYWNGENRMIQMVCLTNAANGSKLRLTFAYDYKGRRISKQIETWTGSAWSVTLSNKFLYDGWNLIAELNGTNNAVIRSYMWGTDLSGSMQGAGGVAGLLAVSSVDLGVQSFVAFDGNGNVAALVKASDGTVSANYEYGPFGELTKASGLMARNNPVRFSTKYQDDETDLVYYGYRYYNASTGRWESRDPIDDFSFRNTIGASLIPRSRQGSRDRDPSSTEYGFVNNQCPKLVDLFGLTTWRGKCSFISAGEFIGGIIIDCDLVSFCEVGDDNHREHAHVVGFILDLTVGIPIEITVSENTFVTPEKTGYKAFRGSAAITQIGWSTGPIGYALYKIKLGDGISAGVGSEQLGVALGESAGVGFSISKGTKQCCNDK